jgi:hypothetical protein
MAMKSIHPFKNESESLEIEGLTIENRLDRVSIYGNIDITLDKEGLAKAKCLKSILDATLSELQSTDLPDKISNSPVESVKNPFE